MSVDSWADDLKRENARVKAEYDALNTANWRDHFAKVARQNAEYEKVETDVKSWNVAYKAFFGKNHR